MADDNKRVNEAFIQSYERGKVDGRIEANSSGGCTTRVYNPTYYNDSKITPFDVIDDWKLDFYLGNVVKYLKRVGKKDGNSRLQDLKKIRTYVAEAIKREEASGK